MATLVVGGVTRFTLHQEFFGHDVINLVDMHIDTSLGGATRPEANADQAKIIAGAWHSSIMGGLSSQLRFTHVSWVDLNSEDGDVGDFAGDDDVGLPQVGGAGGSDSPANVAILVRKNTSAGRGIRSGRMYVCGINEGTTDSGQPNHVKDTDLASFNGSFEEFLDSINQDGEITPPVYDSRMCVVHAPAIGDTSFSEVSSLIVQQTLATQRRRLRG